ncbi:MAG: CotH kinase family protein [Bacteroidales bacterium]|nr:CotH kinase family protein [Bacteroidales bacterium]
MKRWLLILSLLMLPFFGTSQPAEKACFSVPGGFYEESPILEIFPFYQQHHIRFTTNGNRPTAQSRRYTEPLLLDESLYSTSDIYTIQISPSDLVYVPDSVQHCIVIRAAVFDENDSCISEVATNSYFIHALDCDTHGLPVVSICADSLDLFDFETGIFVPGIHQWDPVNSGNYYQRGREWERGCNVEFYESDNTGINQRAGLRTHGGASRRLPQKNLKVLAREEYGKKRFNHAFFQEIPNNSFKHLVIRPFCCNVGNTTGIQDVLSQSVVRGLDVDGLAFRLSVLYLNGEYWGIYAIEETPDEHYIEDHYGFDTDEINIIKDWNKLDHGDSTNWLELCQWVESADMSSEADYEIMEERIDMNNFIDYWIYEIYSCNFDWPIHNIRCWQRGDGKWRWIFYDGDSCFAWDCGTFNNAIDSIGVHSWANAESTLFFRKLIRNPRFMERFYFRFYELMSEGLQYSNTHYYFNMLRETIEPEIPNQCSRFGFPADVEQWERDLTIINNFLAYLNTRIRNGLDNFYEEIVGLEDSPVSFLCYPNPTQGDLRLLIDAENYCCEQIVLYDLLGRKVYSQSAMIAKGSNELSLSLNLTSGVYLLKVGSRAVKIVKQ